MHGPRSYLELDVWQHSMDLMVHCYALTRELPREERFGLSAQLQRASLSVPSNIAEGNGRHTRGEYLNQLSVARGSLNEAQTLILATTRIGFVSTDRVAPLLEDSHRVCRMLHGLRNSLEPRPR